MASSPTSRLAFLSEDGTQLESPLEWARGLVEVRCDVASWRQARLTCNGEHLPLHVRELEDRPRVLAHWPLSGAGRYELELVWADGSWEERRICAVSPRKLDPAEVETMLDDLQRRLPASIAIALRRAGALAGIDIVPPRETTFAEEVHRLARAIDGTSSRAGLATVLDMLSGHPYRVLRSHERWTPRHRAHRVDPARLVQSFSRAGNIGSDRLPVSVPERPVFHSSDTYENRLLKTFYEQVNVRLRTVLNALERVDADALAVQAKTLLGRLGTARRKAAFLDQAARLSEPPSRVTMLLLKQSEYRAAMEGFIEFRRRALVRLHEPAAEAPLQNLPFLYQSWGLLEVVAVVLELAADLGYRVDHQRLSVRREGELWIQLLRNGAPVAELTHPASGAVVRVVPQRRYTSRNGQLRSVSFDQIPDVAIELELGADVSAYVFDPKYKLRSEDLEGRRADVRPKKVDVDAMHAYRDSIRDSSGNRVVHHAALLYPGDEQTYGDGISAICARPGGAEQLQAQVRSVLLDPFQRAADAGSE